MSLQRSKTSLFLVNFLTGISDGLVLPLAACIIAYPFFSGQPLMIAATGMLIAIAGAVIFGWARYAGEQEEIRHKHPELGQEEAEKEISLLQNIGIDPDLTAAMKVEMEQERALWLKEVQENELGWEGQDNKRACRAGLHTGGGFFTGGLLVALPFAAVSADLVSLLIPSVWALLCLAVQGGVKANITGRHPAGAVLLQVFRGLAIIVIAGLLALLISRLREA